jgi:hypothetical protein
MKLYELIRAYTSQVEFKQAELEFFIQTLFI